MYAEDIDAASYFVYIEAESESSCSRSEIGNRDFVYIEADGN